MRFLVPTLLAVSAFTACAAFGNHPSGSSVSTTTTTTEVVAASPGVSPEPLASSGSDDPPAALGSPVPNSGMQSPSAELPATSPGPNAAATASPTLDVPVAAPNEPPQIVGVNINKTTVYGGDTVSGSVRTSSNVASVEARIATYSIVVPRTGIGHFALSYVVPSLPFFLHRTYDMTIIARNTRGDATSKTIPITIH